MECLHFRRFKSSKCSETVITLQEYKRSCQNVRSCQIKLKNELIIPAYMRTKFPGIKVL